MRDQDISGRAQESGVHSMTERYVAENHSLLKVQWIVDAFGVVLGVQKDVDGLLRFSVNEREVSWLQTVQTSPTARREQFTDFSPTCSAGAFLSCYRGHAVPGRNTQRFLYQRGM